MADPVIGPPAPVAAPIGPPAPVATPPTPAAVPAGSVTLYDRDSKPVVVDSEQAHAAILSGQLGYAPGTRIPVRVDGKIGTVDADGLSEAVSKYGAKPVTGKEYHQHELQQQYGSTPQAALAFGTAALDSATIGASNAIISGLGGQHTREYLRNVEEANPAATTAGDVAGFVAPIAADVLSAGTLTGPLAAAEAARVAGRVGERALVRGAEEAAGKGLARTALETAITGPTRAVSAIGDLAESATRSIVGKNAESAAARTAQNIIAGGVRGGVEGGLYGVGQEAGHQFLQDDPNFTGETLATAFTHGALVGGALGGLTHGVAGMLKNKAPRALSDAAEGREVGAETKALGEAGTQPSTITKKAADAIIAQVDDPKKREILQKAWDERGPHGFAQHSGEMLDDAKRTIVKSLDETLEAGHTVDMASFGEAKSNHMAKLVPVENLRPARDMALKVWADASKVIDGLGELPLNTGERSSVKRLKMWLDAFGKVPAEEWKSPATLFDKIDDFKRRIGKEAGFGKSAFGREESTRQFNELYDRVRLSLEDQGTWGAAATAQKEVNLATADMISTGQKFARKFTDDYGRESGILGAPKYVADPSKVSGFVDGLTTPAKDLDMQMFGDYSRKRIAFLDAVSRNYDLPPDVRKAVAKEIAAHASMSGTIAKTGNEVSQANKLKQVLADEHGHGIHGIIGLALDSVTKPGLSLARLAELEATKNRAIAKIQNGFKQVRAALDGGAKPGLTPKLETHDTYEQRRTSVLAAASQPDVVQASLNGATAPVAPHAPDTANAFRGASIRTLQYLMTALPKPPPPRADALTPQIDMEDWQPNDQQKYTFNQQYDIVTHPEHALTYVANGTITATQVDALAAAQPAHLAHQRNMLQSSLASRTKPVPYAMQGPVQTFLGKPQMAPELQPFMQPVTPPQQNQSPPKRPLKFSDTTTLNASNVK